MEEYMYTSLSLVTARVLCLRSELCGIMGVMHCIKKDLTVSRLNVGRMSPSLACLGMMLPYRSGRDQITVIRPCSVSLSYMEELNMGLLFGFYLAFVVVLT